MNTYNSATSSGGITSWFRRAESWLDDRGKPAWIIAMVLGFVFFWPIGLALLGYMIWSKRMFGNKSCARRTNTAFGSHRVHQSSGNMAFDAYKAETLRRLEEEQDAFDSFLQRLRDAKDKSEFDTFMQDRARGARTDTPETPREGSY